MTEARRTAARQRRARVAALSAMPPDELTAYCDRLILDDLASETSEGTGSLMAVVYGLSTPLGIANGRKCGLTA